VTRDPSEIILKWWFAAQETFLINVNVEKSCVALIYCEKHDPFFSDSDKMKVQNQTAFIW